MDKQGIIKSIKEGEIKSAKKRKAEVATTASNKKVGRPFHLQDWKLSNLVGGSRSLELLARSSRRAAWHTSAGFFSAIIRPIDAKEKCQILPRRRRWSANAVVRRPGKEMLPALYKAVQDGGRGEQTRTTQPTTSR